MQHKKLSHDSLHAKTSEFALFFEQILFGDQNHHLQNFCIEPFNWITDMNTMSHWKEIAFLVCCRELRKRKVASMALNG